MRIEASKIERKNIMEKENVKALVGKFIMEFSEQSKTLYEFLEKYREKIPEVNALAIFGTSTFD
jgi:hypothetical protein